MSKPDKATRPGTAGKPDGAPPALRLVLENAPDALVLLDDRLRCRWANAGARRAFGGGEPAAGRPIDELLPGLAGTRAERALLAAAADRRVHVVRRLVDAAGRSYELHAAPGEGGLAVLFRDASRAAAAVAALGDERR